MTMAKVLNIGLCNRNRFKRMETFEFKDISDQQDSYIENLNFGISDSTVLWFAKEIIKQRILLWCRITTIF